MVYTRKDAETAFENLARAMEASTGPTHYMENGEYRQNVGVWSLDYSGENGGYVVYEMLDHGVGLSYRGSPPHRSRVLRSRLLCTARVG